MVHHYMNARKRRSIAPRAVSEPDRPGPVRSPKRSRVKDTRVVLGEHGLEAEVPPGRSA